MPHIRELESLLLDEENFPLLDEEDFVPSAKCSHMTDRVLTERTLNLMQEKRITSINTRKSTRQAMDRLLQNFDADQNPSPNNRKVHGVFITREALEAMFRVLTFDETIEVLISYESDV